jgi:hypothetical protein
MVIEEVLRIHNNYGGYIEKNKFKDPVFGI